MLRNLILSLIALPTLSANASFYDICEFDTKVLDVTSIGRLDGSVSSEDNLGLGIIVKVVKSTKIGGHTDCQGYVGNIHTLQIDTSKHQYNKGDDAKLKYETWSGLTPTGVWSKTEWTPVADTSKFIEVPVELKNAVFDTDTNEVVVTVSHGGGCGEHNYGLTISPCRETHPVQCDVVVTHNTDDTCEAYLTKEVRFSLKKAGFDESYYSKAFVNVAGGVPGKTFSIRLPEIN